MRQSRSGEVQMWISLPLGVLGRSESTTSSISFDSQDWLKSWREALPGCYSVALAGVQVGSGRILDAGGIHAYLDPGRRNTTRVASRESGGVCMRTDH